MLTFLRLLVCSRSALVAENLFLRKQLALFLERKAKPRRTTPMFRLMMVTLGQLFDWRTSLVIVKPDTFLGWHRTGFKMFWRWKSRKRGRPALPQNLRELIREMASANATWGEGRVADELSLKLGILVSPRTVSKYLAGLWPSGDKGDQRWSTFVRNHATAIVACDFFQSMTVDSKILSVFIVMELGARRMLHFGVTAHPTAEWTIQQFRELLPYQHPYQFLIHDRDSIFSRQVDLMLKSFGLGVLKTPVRSPKANAYCERLVGTTRRECLDYVIPINERHLRRTIREWTAHYNRGRPHSALGPGIPEPQQASAPASVHRHKLPAGFRVTAKPVLGGLHQEYGLQQEAA